MEGAPIVFINVAERAGLTTLQAAAAEFIFGRFAPLMRKRSVLGQNLCLHAPCRVGKEIHSFPAARTSSVKREWNAPGASAARSIWDERQIKRNSATEELLSTETPDSAVSIRKLPISKARLAGSFDSSLKPDRSDSFKQFEVIASFRSQNHKLRDEHSSGQPKILSSP